jgi:hypothetical protein
MDDQLLDTRERDHDDDSRDGEEEVARPNFAPNTTFTGNALAVDRDGVAWWVRPSIMQYFRA